MTTRKAVAAALLKQLTSGGQFNQYGRRLTNPEGAASPGKPALFLIKPNENYTTENEGTTPPVRTLDFYAVIYTDVGNDETAVPADVIDDLLDAVDTQMAPGAVDQLRNGGRQTLGDLVYNAYVSGEPDIGPGDEQGKGSTVVPIKVVLKDYP